MIKPTEGTFNPRANVSKLLKWGSIHFDSCREFASGGRKPDHDNAGVTREDRLFGRFLNSGRHRHGTSHETSNTGKESIAFCSVSRRHAGDQTRRQDDGLACGQYCPASGPYKQALRGREKAGKYDGLQKCSTTHLAPTRSHVLASSD